MEIINEKIKQNTFRVGGAVRDKILGIESQDNDFVIVGITLQEMIDSGYIQIYLNEFPVFLKDGNEYALARTEIKNNKGGYKGFDVLVSVNVTLEEDLKRRDLTINSIAEDQNGNFIDPFNGISDINNRILKHTSGAFKEDPVRLLRVCRFMSQLCNFTVHEDTLELMREMVVSGDLSNLTSERIWIETEKALKSQTPWLYFETLRDCGALKVIFPELDKLIDIPQPIKHHPENCCFVHTMLSLRQAAKLGNNNPVINFAVLVHDLGKAETPKDVLPSHIGHELAGAPLVNAICDRLKVPFSYRDLSVKVAEHHLHSHRALEMRPSKIVDLLNEIGSLKQNGFNILQMFLISCESDAKGRLGLEYREYPQSKYIVSVYNAIINMDNSAIVEKFKGQGKKISEQILQSKIKMAADVKNKFMEGIENDYKTGIV